MGTLLLGFQRQFTSRNPKQITSRSPKQIRFRNPKRITSRNRKRVYMLVIRDQSEFKLEGGGDVGGGRRKCEVPKFFRGVVRGS